MRISGRQLDDVLHALWNQAMGALSDYEPHAYHVDPRTAAEITRHPAFNHERRTLSGIPIEVHPVRLPMPMSPLGSDAIYNDAGEYEPMMLSIESRHRFSERPIFFNWDGNPEGYK